MNPKITSSSWGWPTEIIKCIFNQDYNYEDAHKHMVQSYSINVGGFGEIALGALQDDYINGERRVANNFK